MCWKYIWDGNIFPRFIQGYSHCWSGHLDPGCREGLGLCRLERPSGFPWARMEMQEHLSSLPTLVPHPPDVKQDFSRGFPVVLYFHMNFCNTKEFLNELRKFCSRFPTMTAAHALHSSRCENHTPAAAPRAFTSLQQSPALQCCGGQGRVVHPRLPSPRLVSHGMPTGQNLSAPGTS